MFRGLLGAARTSAVLLPRYSQPLFNVAKCSTTSAEDWVSLGLLARVETFYGRFLGQAAAQDLLHGRALRAAPGARAARVRQARLPGLLPPEQSVHGVQDDGARVS